MEHSDLTFKDKIRLCQDLLEYFDKMSKIDTVEKVDQLTITDLSNKLNRWSKELRVRKLYYDV